MYRLLVILSTGVDVVRRGKALVLLSLFGGAYATSPQSGLLKTTSSVRFAALASLFFVVFYNAAFLLQCTTWLIVLLLAVDFLRCAWVDFYGC